MVAEEKPTTLVLPLSDFETLELQSSLSIDSWAEAANKTELISVYLIQKVPALCSAGKNVALLVERALADLLSAIQNEVDLADFRVNVKGAWSQEEFNEGLRLLEREQIGLLNDEEKVADVVKHDGTWDFGHIERLSRTRNPFIHAIETAPGQTSLFTDPQGRILTQALADNEESLHIQGTAGGGKTHLVRALVDSFGASKTLLLAQTKTQLDALLRRIGNPVIHAETFASLSYRMLLEDAGIVSNELPRRSSSNFLVSDQDIAQHFSFSSVASLGPATVAEMCRRIVASFCHSDDDEIDGHHLPRTADRFSEADKGILIANARRLWAEIEAPSSLEFMLPLRGYHRIKLLSLRGASIPPGYLHVIVDESHELTPSMVKILDESPSSIITLGDQYQRLSGTSQSRRPSIRSREIHLNVRAGRQIESVLNPILEKHPIRSYSPVVGNSTKRTLVSFYEKPAVPDHPAMILVRDEWSVLEWMQRLSHQRAKFAVLPGARHSLSNLMKGCIDLYQQNTRSRHPFLFRYPDWESLARSQQSNNAFLRIARMLEKGYSHQDFENSVTSMVPLEKAKITLGRVEDAKNAEVDTVVLAPELLSDLNEENSSFQLASKLSAIYTAASRARFHLVVPGYLRDWLEDQ
ncbi:AAA family ATPase [Marinobacter sp. LN3S78]|uniref:AAA family ATPase n=1 Tax=Marinobacter sp. LN3S78 TaxID=3382300 RepID=UPI00387AEF47